jgi:hypothetical protein
MTRLGQFTIDDVIACVIRDEARRLDCPEFLALGIAGAESNWDPLALGDNGRSFGLFQLYIDGGQGSDWQDNPVVLYNPRFNSRIAIPPIKRAYDAATAYGLTGTVAIRATAVASGHPGPVDLYDDRVDRIVDYCLRLVFNRDGTCAQWPAHEASVCSSVGVDDPWGSAPPAPTP